jgi:hypothetical protein
MIIEEMTALGNDSGHGAIMDESEGPFGALGAGWDKRNEDNPL